MSSRTPTPTSPPTSSSPVDPASVRPETPLTVLNLNWSERDLPERERTKHVHRLHPYLGKFIPQLVEVFLRRYFAPGHTVLDPFCGSGTTLVQSLELGLDAVGCDVSAFNALLCRVKTAQYDLTRLRLEANAVLARTESLSRTAGDGPAADRSGGYLDEWYHPRALLELLLYRSLIESGEYQYADFLRVVLSRAARSARLTPHFDLDFPSAPQREPYWCYKHRRQCAPTRQSLKFLRRYTLDSVRRVEQFASVRGQGKAQIHHGDSLSLPLPPIDGVVTSPPYVGLIDYHAQHAYAYALLGLEDRRAAEIGPAAAGKSAAARERYVEAIATVFRRCLEVMPSGGRLVVVAADRANLYEEIAGRAGVEVEAVLHRHVDRRTGCRSSAFYESVFIWRKS
jgi:DNA modification methylase